MVIETIDQRVIDGKTFIAHDYEDKIFGDVTSEQEDFLTDGFYS